MSFLIRTSPDIMDMCSSPRLFAAYHVLHRLLVPRHSPYALSSLTYLSLDSKTFVKQIFWHKLLYSIMNTLVYLDNKIAFIITFLEYLFLNNYIFFNVLYFI